MFRQSPRRNGRKKGLKIKHVLQISVLLGVSIWLLYQVHSDSKKVSVTTNISENLENDSSNDMIKLGRKDLRPRVKETTVQDRKETKEHKADEEGNENEPEVLVHDHESEEGEGIKHEEVGENESADGGEESREEDDGIEKATEMENEHIKVEMEGRDNEEAKRKENGDKGREQTGVKNEKIKTEGMKQSQHEGKRSEDGANKNEVTKEENGSKKIGEKKQEKKGSGLGDAKVPWKIENEKGKEGNTKENKKDSTRLRSEESKNEDDGRKKEVKEVHKPYRKEEGDGKQSEEEVERKDDKQSDHGEEIKGKGNENKSNEQNKVVVVEKAEKEEKTEKEDGKITSPNSKELEISIPSEDHDQKELEISIPSKDHDQKELEISIPSEDHDQSVREENYKGENVSSEGVNDSQNTNNNGRTEKNGIKRGQKETGEDNTTSSKGHRVDQSQSGSNPSHSKTNEHNKALDASSNAATAFEKERQGDGTSTTKSDQNRNEKVGNLSTQTVSKKQTVQHKNSANKKTSPGSYSDTAGSVNSTGNEKNGKVENQKADSDSGTQDKEQVSNGESNQNEAKNGLSSSNKNGNNAESEQKNEKDELSSGVSVPQEEKDARTDLGTLPESGTGGSRNHENAAAAE